MVTQDGSLTRARPMRGLARPEQNAIWFFTNRESQKQDEIASMPNACLAYADVKNQTFVSVSGTITTVEDRQIVDELWSEGVEVYYPGGRTDPNIVLLKFVPEFGEYWDAPSSTIVLAIKFLQAKVSGEPPEFGTTGTARMG
jgi:general stress protein 26